MRLRRSRSNGVWTTTPKMMAGWGCYPDAPTKGLQAVAVRRDTSEEEQTVGDGGSATVWERWWQCGCRCLPELDDWRWRYAMWRQEQRRRDGVAPTREVTVGHADDGARRNRRLTRRRRWRREQRRGRVVEDGGIMAVAFSTGGCISEGEDAANRGSAAMLLRWRTNR